MGLQYMLPAKYSSLYEFQYDSYRPTLGRQCGNHIEMSANCSIDCIICLLRYNAKYYLFIYFCSKLLVV